MVSRNLSVSRVSFSHAMLSCVILLCVFLIASLWMGAVSINIFDVLFGSSTQDNLAQSQAILFQIRLPRILLAVFVGALLSMSGVAMQGLFRNPLADPSLIGVTAGASAGGSVVIALGGSLLLGAMGLWLISFGAFLGGLLAVWIVYRLSHQSNNVVQMISSEHTSVATMLLAGIAITALASSVTNLLEFFVDNNLLRQISLWKMGGLDGASWSRVLIVLAIFCCVAIIFPRYASALNAFLLGESQARYLGVNVENTKKTLILLTAAAVGVSVAMAGAIAFVGLVVPHIMRLLIGPDHKNLFWASAVAGAILLVVADLLARLIVMPAELPVGLVTALVGAPFFIFLLTRQSLFKMS